MFKGKDLSNPNEARSTILICTSTTGGDSIMGVNTKVKFAQKSNITFEDVLGVDEAKAELQEVVQYLKDPNKYTKLGTYPSVDLVFLRAYRSGQVPSCPRASCWWDRLALVRLFSPRQLLARLYVHRHTDHGDSSSDIDSSASKGRAVLVLLWFGIR